MELLHMGQDAVPMMLPLLPLGTQVGATAKPAPLKTNSLSRLEDLQQHLRRCDDPAYLNRYVKLLSSMPRTVLAELTRKVKARSAWLSAEEQREYKRAKVLNVMGAPCYAPGSGEHDHGCPVGGAASADADAFCSQVLGGSGGSGADWGADADRAGAAAVAAAFAASDMKLERLDMSQEQQPFATPADAARTKLASLASRQPASGSEPASASAGACAADTPWTGVSLPSGLATGDGGVVADHQISRISPDYQPALAGLEAAAAGAGAKHSGRVRQATLSACDT